MERLCLDNVFAIGALVVYSFALRAGRLRKGTYQDEVFYGGNPVPQDGEDLAVPASSSYWGFTKALASFMSTGKSSYGHPFRLYGLSHRHGCYHFAFDSFVGGSCYV